jgi:hypothetical protein
MRVAALLGRLGRNIEIALGDIFGPFLTQEEAKHEALGFRDTKKTSFTLPAMAATARLACTNTTDIIRHRVDNLTVWLFSIRLQHCIGLVQLEHLEDSSPGLEYVQSQLTWGVYLRTYEINGTKVC